MKISELKKRKNSEYSKTTLWIEKGDWKSLTEICDEHEVSVSEAVRTLIKEFIKKQKK